MNRYSTCKLALVALLLATGTFAQQPQAAPPDKTYAITGNMQIEFKSHKDLDDAGKPTAGVKDTYTLDLTVAETLQFGGKVEYLPPLFNSFGMAKQDSHVYYSLDLGIKNPANLSSAPLNIGRFVGEVPVDRKGVYQYDRGTARIAVDAHGQSAGFESKFQGTAAGKPPTTGSLTEKIAQQATDIQRSIGGKQVKIAVTKYDRMMWDATLPAGPVRMYPETHIAGEMLYDYERTAWYFNGLTMTYQVGGKTVTDKLTGDIKWVKTPNYKSTGEGEYQFDVRVNEPEQGATTGEAAAFAPADEAAFFASDAAIPSLQGKMKYKDTLIAGDEENVGASKIEIALTGNKLTKFQVVNLAKLIVFADIVPLNSD